MNRWILFIPLAILAACQPSPPPAEALPAEASVTRPDFSLTTDAAYDFSVVDPYTGHHQAVYDYIDAHERDHVAAVQRWVRQRSISAQNDGVVEMAEMLRGDLESMGFQEAELVPTDGHPGVWGYYDAGADKTLAVYLMYDVQPVNPEGLGQPAFRSADSRPRVRQGHYGARCYQPEGPAARVPERARIDHRRRRVSARKHHGRRGGRGRTRFAPLLPDHRRLRGPPENCRRCIVPVQFAGAQRQQSI